MACTRCKIFTGQDWHLMMWKYYRGSTWIGGNCPPWSSVLGFEVVIFRTWWFFFVCWLGKFIKFIFINLITVDDMLQLEEIRIQTIQDEHIWGMGMMISGSISQLSSVTKSIWLLSRDVSGLISEYTTMVNLIGSSTKLNQASLARDREYQYTIWGFFLTWKVEFLCMCWLNNWAQIEGSHVTQWDIHFLEKFQMYLLGNICSTEVQGLTVLKSCGFWACSVCENELFPTTYVEEKKCA